MASVTTKRYKSKFTMLGFGLAWATCVSLGLTWINRYQMTPGKSAMAATVWPAATNITMAGDRANLVMFVHPQCPCSRSSLGELANIMARRGDRVAACVAFFSPEGQPQDWSHSDLWSTAQAIPGVKVLSDTGGTLAREFGAATSGQVFLYDAHGRLLFNGGITSSRGHFGDNAGEDAVLALLGDHAPAVADVAVAPVYGCPIDDPQTLILPTIIDSKNKVCTP